MSAPRQPDKAHYCGGCGYDRPVAVVTTDGYRCTTCMSDPVAPVRRARISEAITPTRRKR